jgi:hypothetical protein
MGRHSQGVEFVAIFMAYLNLRSHLWNGQGRREELVCSVLASFLSKVGSERAQAPKYERYHSRNG